MSSKYTTARKRRKSADRPKKPYKDFPLYAHPSGNWAKKINGKLCYDFGRWGRIRQGVMEHLPYEESWKAALASYKAKADDLHAGRTPRKQSDDPAGVTVKSICNVFLNYKLGLLQSGEIRPRSFAEYKATADRLVAFFGSSRVDDLTASDFDRLRSSIAKTYGPYRLANEVVRVRSVFKHAKKLDVVPDTFRKPSKKVMRQHRNTGDKRLFTAAEIRQLLNGKTVTKGGKETKLAGASVPLRAMILLGINCGFGNTDLGELTKRAIDLEGGWLDFPRPKTGVNRRCPLWPETVTALRAALTERPAPNDKEDRECFFITVHGRRWVRTKTTTPEDGNEADAKHVNIDAVGLEFGKVLKRLGINGRKGLGFYSLRHTFATTGLQAGDRDAVKALMGHVEGDILASYDETGPSDKRLLAVVNHVHGWLFGQEGGAK